MNQMNSFGFYRKTISLNELPNDELSFSRSIVPSTSTPIKYQNYVYDLDHFWSKKKIENPNH